MCGGSQSPVSAAEEDQNLLVLAPGRQVTVTLGKACGLPHEVLMPS